MSEASIKPLPRQLSAIVIARNEARNLEECLRSVAFCSDVLVVDSGSTDGTQEIARRLGARLIEREWPGYGPQKEFARQAARGEWVLSIDADERVTPPLQDEILAVLAAPKVDAYEIPILSTFLGREMRHSGYWPDYHLRLFRKDAASFSEVPVHESVKTTGRVERLKQPLLHHPVRTLADLARKIDDYSSLGAKSLQNSGRHISPATALARGAFAFFKTYVLKRGFQDGPEGLINAAAHSQTVFWKYAKAWEAGRRQAGRSDP